MESIAFIVGKLINSNLAPNITGNVENNKINVIRMPEDIGFEYCYIDLFKTLLDQPFPIIPLGTILILIFSIDKSPTRHLELTPPCDYKS